MGPGLKISVSSRMKERRPRLQLVRRHFRTVGVVPAADFDKATSANRLVDALTPDEKLRAIRELDSRDWSVVQ